MFQFRKLGRLTCISHLDLQRFMQRAIRRTGLPVAYSQGFRPHPLIAFASALALGQESECELLDVRLDIPVDERRALSAMSAALPPEMPVVRARMVEDRHPALMAALRYADYRIAPPAGDAGALIEAASAYMAQSSVIAMRRTKSGEKPADIRAMTAILRPEGEALFARLKLTEAETLRPDLLTRELYARAGLPEAECRVTRLMLLGERGGECVPLMDV